MLDDRLPHDNMLTMTYYAFTTLSTVGFGDLHPKSDYERFFIAWALLIGVLLFSISLGQLQAFMSEINSQDDDFDDGDALNSFFNMMLHFNRDQELKPELR